MTTYDNTNRGALFKNDKRNHDDDSAPHYKGSVNIDGTEFWLSAWIKTSKAGDKYMSLSVRPKDDAKLKRTYAQRRDDEIDMLS